MRSSSISFMARNKDNLSTMPFLRKTWIVTPYLYAGLAIFLVCPDLQPSSFFFCNGISVIFSLFSIEYSDKAFTPLIQNTSSGRLSVYTIRSMGFARNGNILSHNSRF